MSTLISLNFRQSAYAAETGRVPICLITVDHADLADPIRISTDPTQRLTGAGYTDDTEVIYGTVSRGDTFVFLPVRLRISDDSDEGPGDIALEVDNVHRTYTETIRSIMTPPTVLVEMVMDNALDTVDGQWPEFILKNVKYDASVISGTVKWETQEDEPFPCGSFTPAQFPGLFG